MIYIAILTEKSADEVNAVCRRIAERVSQFVEDYPDRENTFVEPWLEAPDIYVQQARARSGLTAVIERRLDRCARVLYFEGPGNPHECPDQVSILKLYLEALAGSVIEWGDIDYGWPLIQLSEDALASLSALPDEPRLSAYDIA
ncbi:hypothetical protein [Hyphomicrobium sp. CS1BSMeth3]|uniref:hypothetical protein n=1 Tax=Hyphomicrobium sp. CS1BSMeth3 TaxID=1892844 RepID=UPI00093125E0|nr:hypothetical protein [Hyphomicrobium sp. CS1BSMeth3]